MTKNDNDIDDDGTRNCYVKLSMNIRKQNLHSEEILYLRNINYEYLKELSLNSDDIRSYINKENDFSGLFNVFVANKRNINELIDKKGRDINNYEFAKEALQKKVKIKVNSNYTNVLQDKLLNDVFSGSDSLITAETSFRNVNQYPGEYSSIDKFKAYRKTSAFSNNNVTGIVKIGVYIEKFSNNTLIGSKLVLNENNFLESNDSFKKTIFDTNVKYNQLYTYKISDVFSYSTNELGDYNVICHFLVTGAPQVFNIETVTKIKVNEANAIKTRKLDNSMLISWSMPDNPKNDVIGFHVLKRNSLSEPYRIIGICDFSEGFALYNILEQDVFSSYNIVKSKDKILSFKDNDYDKKTGAIYTIIAYNAHGELSKYSEQVYVEYNINTNMFNNELISYKGASLDTPNMYVIPKNNFESIRNDIVSVLPRTSGKQKLTVYCTPDFHNITLLDDQKLTTLKEKYLLSIFKLENQTNFNDVIEIANFS